MKLHLVSISLLSLACSAAGQDESGSVYSVTATGVETCGMSFDPVPELLDGSTVAASRWSTATGCDISIAEGGIPVVLADPDQVRDSAGVLKRSTTEIKDGVPIVIKYRRGPLLPWTVETMLTHEFGHALGAHGHTQSGIMAEATKLGAKIDEEALELVCAELQCVALAPEL